MNSNEGTASLNVTFQGNFLTSVQHIACGIEENDCIIFFNEMLLEPSGICCGIYFNTLFFTPVQKKLISGRNGRMMPTLCQAKNKNPAFPGR
jgi:hypothetical protein